MLKCLSKKKVDIAQELSSTECIVWEEAMSHLFVKHCYCTICLAKIASLGSSLGHRAEVRSSASVEILVLFSHA